MKLYSKFGSKFNNSKYEGVKGRSGGGYKSKFEGHPEKKQDEEKEKKLLGDSGYDCNYFNGKNNLDKDCFLRRKNENEERVKDEA